MSIEITLDSFRECAKRVAALANDPAALPLSTEEVEHAQALAVEALRFVHMIAAFDGARLTVGRDAKGMSFMERTLCDAVAAIATEEAP